jgi:putative endopeptidase
VQGEAVADLGAVKCMLNLLEENKEDVDYRAFFEAVAKTWREVITWETEYYILMLDTHPLSYLRVNAVLQQFPQFHETYGITEGDGMWLAPEGRVPVW